MSVKNNLRILKDKDSQLSESIFDQYIISRFNFGLSGLEISNIEGFFKKIEKSNYHLKKHKFKLQRNGNTLYYLERSDTYDYVSTDIDNIFVIINVWDKDKAYVELYGASISCVEKFYADFEEFFLYDEDYYVQLHSFYVDGGLKYDVLNLKKEELSDISKKYFRDFIDTNMFFEEFFKAKESILVLSGKPGIGKSKFATMALKYLIENGSEFVENSDMFDSSNINVAYVKNEAILATDMFWVTLKKNDYTLVILDDLDHFLSAREQSVSTDLDQQKNQFISHFLSFSDGLIPNKTKFIITTNKNIDSIDKALLREGRLFGVFEFSELTYEEAKDIWVEAGLKIEDFEIEFKGKEKILQSVLGSLIHSYKQNDKMKRKSFLKEDSKADISSKFLREKKVGLI